MTGETGGDGWKQARKRIPEAIRQAWSIVVTVNEQNEVQAIPAHGRFGTAVLDRKSG